MLPLRLEGDCDESLPVESLIAIHRRDRVVQPVDHILEIRFGSDRIAVPVCDEVGLGREARCVAGGASRRRVVQVIRADEDIPLPRDLREPGVADVHDVVHPGLDGLRRVVVGRDGQHSRPQDVIGMVGVDFEVVRPPREGPADVLGVSLALAVVDDLHRVLAIEIGLGPAGLRVDRVDPEIGRDIAVEQIDLEIDEDGPLFGDLEPEPVQAGPALIRVLEVIDIVGRAIHVAAEPQLVGLLPGVVRLGLDRGTVVAG